MNETTYISKGPCPSCPSSDALATFSDGHTHCFSCGTHTEASEVTTSVAPTVTVASGLLSVDVKALGHRKINEETCKKWGYGYADYKGQSVQVATYYDNKLNAVAQKIRFRSKDFRWLGNPKLARLFGEQLWRDGGRMVVVTEGEIDALSVSQVYGNKYPVVSLPNGAQSAKRAILNSLDWLEKFETVVLCFDNDAAGQAAAVACSSLLSPGKVKLTQLPMKDANEMLQAGKGKQLLDSIWGAKTYRPDGIIAGEEIWKLVIAEDDVRSVPYPWPGMNGVTRGIRTGELVVFCAGTGVGKSQVCREIAHSLINQGEKVGLIMLEESVKRTALHLIGLQMNKPIHLDNGDIDEGALREAFNNAIGEDKVVFYDHWGSLDNDNLLNRVKFMIRSCECRWIVIDHLSLVVSGISEGDERRNIDNAMTRLRSLVQETGAGILLVSHLKRPDGNKGHEEGQRTSLSQLRGSSAIGSLADIVVGLERDLQDGDNKNITTVRCLKNRFSGVTGVCCHLRYDPETGRMTETEELFGDESDGEF